MCCGMSPRALLILISCWAIVQSIIYLVFSVIGILIGNCNYSMTDSRFNYLLYLAYFRDGKCGEINWGVLEVTAPEGVQIIQPDISAVVSRTGAFLYAYLVLSCVWIVTSMSLIVATFTPCMSLMCLKVFSFPWVVTCFGILITDIVATVFHIIDITNTTDTSGFLTFLGITNVEELLPALAGFPQYILPLPAVTMMLVSFRVVLLWAINLSCLIYVIRGVRKMLKNELMKKKKAIRPDFGYPREFNRPDVHSPQSPHSIEDPLPQMSEIPRYNDTSVANQYQYDNNGFNSDPVQPQVPQTNRYMAPGGNYVFVSEKRSTEPLKGGIPPRSEDGMSSRLSNSRSLDSVEDISRTSSNNGTRSQTSDRTGDYDQEMAAPVERHSYLSNDSMFDNRRSHNGNGSRPNPVDPPPALIKPQQPQYMRQHQQIREEEPQWRSSYQKQKLPDELKSQEPWSYFANPDEITRPQRQRHDDELLPPVPVPDYTLHFPKRERPPTKPKPKRQAPSPGDENMDNNNERWSGPEYTY